MTACGGCAGEAADCYLCSICVRDLRDLLLALVSGGPSPHPGKTDSPGLLAELEDEAVGLCRKTDQLRHARIEPPSLAHFLGQPLKHGTAHPIGLLPETADDEEPDLEEARALRHRQLRRQFLAMGRTNERASILASDLHDCLKVWVAGKGGLAVKHGRIMSPPPGWWRPISEWRPESRDYAGFLAQTVHLIALEEDAGAFLKSIKGFVHRINKIIDHPDPPQFVGQCIKNVTEHVHCVDPSGKPTCSKRDHLCAMSLWAKRGSIEVQCPTCRTTHNVEELVVAWLNAEEDKWYTVKELLELIFPRLPPEERVQKTTIYEWIRKGRLNGQTRRSDDDQLMVRLSDLRRLKLKDGDVKATA